MCSVYLSRVSYGDPSVQTIEPCARGTPPTHCSSSRRISDTRAEKKEEEEDKEQIASCGAIRGFFCKYEHGHTHHIQQIICEKT